MSENSLDREREGELTPQEIRPLAEFCCWTTLAIAPILYWLNGPAVSMDQFAVRTALVVLIACGAVALWLFAWIGSGRGSLTKRNVDIPRAVTSRAGQPKP